MRPGAVLGGDHGDPRPCVFLFSRRRRRRWQRRRLRSALPDRGVSEDQESCRQEDGRAREKAAATSAVGRFVHVLSLAVGVPDARGRCRQRRAPALRIVREAGRPDNAPFSRHSFESGDGRIDSTTFRALTRARSPENGSRVDLGQTSRFQRREDRDRSGVFLIEGARLIERTTPSPVSAWLAVETVGSPGSLGALLRNSEAAGFDGLFASRTRVDLHDPRVVGRACAVLSRTLVPCHPDERRRSRRRHDAQVFAATPDGDLDHRNASFGSTVVVLLGDEARGSRDAIRRSATTMAPGRPGQRRARKTTSDCSSSMSSLTHSTDSERASAKTLSSARTNASLPALDQTASTP